MKPIKARSSVAKQVRRGPRSVRVSKVIKKRVLLFVPLFAFALRTLFSGEWHRACYACVSHLAFLLHMPFARLHDYQWLAYRYIGPC